MRNNITFIQQLLGSKVAFSAVVKGNAYGHSISQYCPLAYTCGIRHFSVFSAEEAYNVKKALQGREYTLMIMGQIDDQALAWAIEHQIEFYVFDANRLDAAIRHATATNKKAFIHLEIETGMNRTGFDFKSMTDIMEKSKHHRAAIEVVGICTHLAGAESINNYKRIQDQWHRFKRYAAKLKTYDWLQAKWHMASSAAAIRYPNTKLDMARIGILQYGFFPTQEILAHYLARQKSSEYPLRRVISWKTRVMDTKWIKAGEFVGYGTSYFTNRHSRIALLPVGYAAGYSRSLSNQGKVLINGKRLDVVGTVNMSMMAVDITGVDGIEKGTEVVLIGRQGEGEITVSSFSDFSNLINYELLTRLPQDIPRIIVS